MPAMATFIDQLRHRLRRYGEPPIPLDLINKGITGKDADAGWVRRTLPSTRIRFPMILSRRSSPVDCALVSCQDDPPIQRVKWQVAVDLRYSGQYGR